MCTFWLNFSFVNSFLNVMISATFWAESSIAKLDYKAHLLGKRAGFARKFVCLVRTSCFEQSWFLHDLIYYCLGRTKQKWQAQSIPNPKGDNYEINRRHKGNGRKRGEHLFVESEEFGPGYKKPFTRQLKIIGICIRLFRTIYEFRPYSVPTI